MTTDAVAALYLAQHLLDHQGRKVAVFNPHNKPADELPVIYGFYNGSTPGWLAAELLAQDGTYLGGHVCPAEGYMPADLGILEGTRPDRHDNFQLHYPDGYRMEFVGSAVFRTHEGLRAALALNAERFGNATDGDEA